jgi:hypothetical protein
LLVSLSNPKFASERAAKHANFGFGTLVRMAVAAADGFSAARQRLSA